MLILGFSNRYSPGRQAINKILPVRFQDFLGQLRQFKEVEELLKSDAKKPNEFLDLLNTEAFKAIVPALASACLTLGNNQQVPGAIANLPGVENKLLIGGKNQNLPMPVNKVAVIIFVKMSSFMSG